MPESELFGPDDWDRDDVRIKYELPVGFQALQVPDAPGHIALFLKVVSTSSERDGYHAGRKTARMIRLIVPKKEGEALARIVATAVANVEATVN